MLYSSRKASYKWRVQEESRMVWILCGLSIWLSLILNPSLLSHTHTLNNNYNSAFISLQNCLFPRKKHHKAKNPMEAVYISIYILLINNDLIHTQIIHIEMPETVRSKSSSVSYSCK